ncbi:unnamed protein product [Caenorhabditis auriculariae]|uniref:Saposin B-type domain-containing protein n=1 Tax=Caenorhabditis auriculariae TaxID=2777116 RepID=A0A8S1H218_9PELO|nr:unnamed protein product [Caenorhabditis auriculariae]
MLSRTSIHLLVVLSIASASRIRRSMPLEKKTVVPPSPDYFETKVNEVAGLSCDVCLKAVYGLNYNVIRLKKGVIDMIQMDCEALFHGQAEDIAQCIRVMADKVEKYYNKVESFIDTRHLCVQIRMCEASELL